jgi:ElaB/YqjD/DUF883 family membrane-anchored ribosome-binding protein
MNPVTDDPLPTTDLGNTLPPPRNNDIASATNTSTAAAGSAKPLLDSVVRTAHDAVDRVAAKAAPALERVVSGAQGATHAVQQRARDANDLSHEWADSLRATVRDHPLASLAVALAVGVLVSRLTHGDGH